MIYVIRIFCREVFYRWDGVLGDELFVGRGCLLLYNFCFYSGEGGEDVGRKEGCLVIGGFG